MPHLTSAESKNLFETSVAPRTDAMAAEHVDKRFTIATDLTPAERLETKMSNYPRYDLMDVANIPLRHRGKHY